MACNNCDASRVGIWDVIRLALIVAMAVSLIVVSRSLAHVKADAVRRGFAEWHTTDTDSIEFTWKEPPAPAKY